MADTQKLDSQSKADSLTHGSTTLENVPCDQMATVFASDGVSTSHPHDSTSKYLKVAEFVRRHGGKRVISKVLVANNGIAAVKAIRSIRRWCYEYFEDERAIEFIVMATPEDIAANAEYVRMADHLSTVPGGSNNNNYANIELVLKLALRFSCDAVWAGWGHASENPKLPQRLTENGIAFLGPGSKAMKALGDKVASTILAQSAGVPTAAWSGSGLTVQGDEVSDETFHSACVTTPDEAIKVSIKIGFPVMIKASEGGGGKGIRLVASEANVAAAFRQVAGEIPGSPIFVMRVIKNARHLEVQLVADEYNNAIALHGRDCSVQRRHQKIIEEGPVVAAPKEIWKEMELAAVRLAKQVGYVGAGTIEYLYQGDTSSGQFYFLELNPRLQVEHPVTEWISGVNLPALQLVIAMGVPLGNVPCIKRFYGKTEFEDTVDVSEPTTVPAKGHVIACRVTAENPDEGFQPTSGSIQELTFRNTPDVWGYFSIIANGGVHEYADSQFGHLFAWGENREASRRAMVLALKELSIRGDIRTTVEYLIKLLEMSSFRENRISTSWLDGLIADKVVTGKPPRGLAIVAGAVCKAHSIFYKLDKDIISCLERGQLPTLERPMIDQTIELIYEEEKYSISTSKASPSSYKLKINGQIIQAETRDLSDGGLLLLINGRSNVVYSREEPSGLRVTVGGQTCLFPKEYDPATLISSVNGKLVRYLVENGDHVQKGIPYAELEVMKMYLSLNTPESGVIRFQKSPGSAVEAGTILGTLELDDPSKVRRATPFTGTLEGVVSQIIKYKDEYQNFQIAYKETELCIDGYDSNRGALHDMLQLVGHPKVVAGQLEEALSPLAGRISSGLYFDVEKIIFDLRNAEVRTDTDLFTQQNISELSRIISNFLIALDGHSEREVANMLLAPLLETIKRYETGSAVGYMLAMLLDRYILFEKPFASGKSPVDVVFDMREGYKDNLQKLAEIAISHLRVQEKNIVIMSILNYLSERSHLQFGQIKGCLHHLSQFTASEYSDISLAARLMLTAMRKPGFAQRRKQLWEALIAVLHDSNEASRSQKLHALVVSHESRFDVLVSFLLQGRDSEFGDDVSSDLQCLAAELHIYRSYRSYEVKNIQVEKRDSYVIADWLFRLFSPREDSKSAKNLDRPVFLTSHDSSDNLLRVSSLNSFRMGRFILFPSWTEMSTELMKAMDQHKLNSDNPVAEDEVNVLSIMFCWDNNAPSLGSEDGIRDNLIKFCQGCKGLKEALHRHGIKLITFIVAVPGNRKGEGYPSFYTLRPMNNFNEDQIYRHVDPPMAFQLELSRLTLFDITRFSYPNRAINVFYGTDKENSQKGMSKDLDCRFFVRAVIRQVDVFSTPRDVVVAMPETERIFAEALDSLEMARFDRRFRKTEHNHIFLNIIPTVDIEIEDIETICRRLFLRYASRCWKLRVFNVEIKILSSRVPLSSNVNFIPLRFFLFNPTGHMLRVEGYFERADPKSGLSRLYSIKEDSRGMLHGTFVGEPYNIMDRIQRKRIIAQTLETTYVYDFHQFFIKEIEDQWRRYSQSRLLGGFRRNKIPRKLTEAKELILGGDGLLTEIDRPPGKNNIGMVAWKYTFCTPEYPNGRDVIIIANDITIMSGSFGPKEDALFAAASRYAREKGIPRIYLAANSGARIGVAEEVRQVFKVKWINPEDPSRGFENIFLLEEDAEKLRESVQGIYEDGKLTITDIIGEENGLGVENLMGSGLIAGETSAAYDEIFTLTYVTGRSVGIGAYLVRLGQRVIQKESSAPIILTGFAALNKVLGREVYVSNDQLGGVKVMYPNGISHEIVQDDMEGIQSVFRWLSYVPAKLGDKLPIAEPLDPINRYISFLPTSAPYDPRLMIAGVEPEENLKNDEAAYIPGFFDKGSWSETLGGWAKTVVTGHARLGGVPCGVIAVETRTMEKIIPADPASPETRENVVTQAGQVWFPDSANKTAQAIRDFNKEKLPLFIFSNWRGFSGGMRDMFDEVLKAGSLIVDALRVYDQPVFVYIPPAGELRGGAWVVVDTLINDAQIEMYADENSRGGVLEPEGTIEVKYRHRDLVKTMHRLDSKLIELDAKLGSSSQNNSTNAHLLSDDHISNITDEIHAREMELLPVYKQIAIKFADLHDTPGRMLAKNAIKGIVQWKTAREFFYWRLQRRLGEDRLIKAIKAADPAVSLAASKSLFEKWMDHFGSESEFVEENSDRLFVQWLEDDEDNINSRIEKIRQERLAKEVKETAELNTAALIDGLGLWLSTLDSSKRSEFQVKLQQKIVDVSGSNQNPTGLSGNIARGLLSRIGSFGWDKSSRPPRQGQGKVQHESLDPK